MNCLGKSCTVSESGLPVEIGARRRQLTAKNITPGFFNRRRTYKAYPNLKSETREMVLRIKLYNVLRSTHDDETVIKTIKLILSKLRRPADHNPFDEFVIMGTNRQYKTPLVLAAIMANKPAIAIYLIENGAPLTFPHPEQYALPPTIIGIIQDPITTDNLLKEALARNFFDVASEIMRRAGYHISGIPYISHYTYSGSPRTLKFLTDHGVGKSKVTPDMINNEADKLVPLMVEPNIAKISWFIMRLKELGLDMNTFAGIDNRSLDINTSNVAGLDAFYKLGVPVSPDVILHTVSYYTSRDKASLPAILNVLVKYGANINVTNENGNAIHNLLKRDIDFISHDPVIKQLFDYIRIGVDIRAKDADGKTAADIALERDNVFIYLLLVALGGDYAVFQHTPEQHRYIQQILQSSPIIWWLNYYSKHYAQSIGSAAVSLGRITKETAINNPNIKSHILSFISPKGENTVAKQVYVSNADTIWLKRDKKAFPVAFARLKKMFIDTEPPEPPREYYPVGLASGPIYG